MLDHWILLSELEQSLGRSLDLWLLLQHSLVESVMLDHWILLSELEHSLGRSLDLWLLRLSWGHSLDLWLLRLSWGHSLDLWLLSQHSLVENVMLDHWIPLSELEHFEGRSLYLF